ncbi:hypothetical protein ASPZODRAFT_17941 [Penicilliopsis zonata CBS 506.65]|uniref:THIF-type NAD/FAD binding fold domain-containing protein n=1 Tax=Penicilliopsis zonata CBS 506.65 TaxID=1073090 RepID=A0A1L9SCT3_9EURO|nr:hypothetical protein ASPZODRAFT_17941 [Penicilliopsis zonata CBS 506.65]OJJ45025.1 hypothetical protein ASPZODRAFT_17941 [Penicilliopsis zonata CBS 506.65]
MRTIAPTARILYVGLDPAGEECFRQLIAAGAKQFTILNDKILDEADVARNPWLSAGVGEPVAKGIAGHLAKYDVTVETRVENPLLTEDVLSFSLAITMNAPREVEVFLGKILYEAPPRALIISRCDGFNVKMRSQYRSHKNLDDSTVIEGIDLVPHPEDATPEKCERVSALLKEQFDLSSPSFQSGAALLYAAGAVFASVKGYQPAHRPGAVTLPGHEGEVIALIESIKAEKGLTVSVDEEDVRSCLANGFTGVPFTATLMGGMIAGEGITLLSSRGKPINVAIADLLARCALGIPASTV